MMGRAPGREGSKGIQFWEVLRNKATESIPGTQDSSVSRPTYMIVPRFDDLSNQRSELSASKQHCPASHCLPVNCMPLDGTAKYTNMYSDRYKLATAVFSV
jgi:hypothetical protein